jgi:hypothetical protein
VALGEEFKQLRNGADLVWIAGSAKLAERQKTVEILTRDWTGCGKTRDFG